MNQVQVRRSEYRYAGGEETWLLVQAGCCTPGQPWPAGNGRQGVNQSSHRAK